MDCTCLIVGTDKDLMEISKRSVSDYTCLEHIIKNPFLEQYNWSINNLLKHVKTKYFSILEPGTIYKKNKINSSLEILEKFSSCAMVYSDFNILNLEKKIEKRHFENPLDVRLIVNNIIPNFQNVFRTEPMMNIGGFQNSFQETLAKLLENNIVLHIPESLFYIREKNANYI